MPREVDERFYEDCQRGIARVEQQKEHAFRTAFASGGTEIHVYGPISTSVMQWGIDRGLVERVDGGSLYRLTQAGRKEFTQ